MKLSDLLIDVEKQCHVTVSIEVVCPEVHRCQQLDLLQDQYIHHGELCRFHKLSPHFPSCIANKRRSLQVAQVWKKSFCGFCRNRVWDLAVPVNYHDQMIAVVYLGGISEEPALELKNTLRHYGKFIAQFICFELDHQAGLDNPHSKRRDENFYLSNCQRIIESKFNEPLSLEEVADSLNVTPNHLGKLLQQHLGKSFRELLTERRMRQAEVLVRLHLRMNFSNIALLSGFPDSNYFSSVFKKNFGLSPKAYRARYALQGDAPDTDSACDGHPHQNFPQN